MLTAEKIQAYKKKEARKVERKVAKKVSLKWLGFLISLTVRLLGVMTVCNVS